MAFPAIRAKMQIEGYPYVPDKPPMVLGDYPIFDTYEEWGFIYLQSDNRMAAPEKKRETTKYAEQEGENTDPRTVDDAFDYKVKFLIECPNTNKENANIKIKKFNDAIRKVDENGIKTCNHIAFYNQAKRVMIVGIPEIIAEPESFYRYKGQVLDCVVVELTIHVDTPSLCDFSTMEYV